MSAKTIRPGIARALSVALAALCVALATLGLALLQPATPAFAAEGTPVAEVTLKSSIDELTFTVFITPMGESNPGCYSAYTSLDRDRAKIVIGDDEEKVKVSVKCLRPDLIDAGSLYFDKEIAYERYANGEVNFPVKGSPMWAFCTYRVDMTVSPVFYLKAITNVSSKGFNPSKGNFLTLYALLGGDLLQYNDGTGKMRASITMRVLNSKGKAVYSLTAKNIVLIDTCSLQWDGKASKKNPAKVKAGSYVKPGTYTFDVVVTCTYDGEFVSQLKDSVKFKVSKKAPKGAKGRAKAKALVLLTGDARVDYLAERMLKEAGVKQSMSADKKVKKIYTYMTKKFTHNHGDKKWKLHYNLVKLKGQVAKYKKAADAKVAKGKAYYSYKFYDKTFMGLGEYWGLAGTMAYRGGVCDDNAAVFEVLCNHAGVEAYKYNGYYVNTNGSKTGHAWNSAVVNGKEYFYDIDVEIQNRGKGQGNYYWYKKTLAQAKKNHKFM